MAYNVENLTKLKHLKQLAEKIKTDFATKEELTTLSSSVPTKVSQLTNDSKFQTDTEVATSIATAVASADHLQRKKVDNVSAIDASADGADKFIYMVPKTGGKNGDKFDEYMVIDGAVEPVGDWAVDLSNYVEKVDGKGLSTNDFTDADKEKMDALPAVATDAEVTEMLTEVFGAGA